MPITSLSFKNFKALQDYSVALQRMNVLVGPNNSGKSTLLSAFRVLEHALRTARSRRASRVRTHRGRTANGHQLSHSTIPISLENIHTDYLNEDSRIEFRYSNGNKLFLYFPADGGTTLYWDVDGRSPVTASGFRAAFPDDIQVIPVLGPVEQEEFIVTDETVRRAAGTPRASRHFRNYWHKYPIGFDDFQALVEKTWPGMSISKPELPNLLERRLVMFCSEARMDRELFWSGLGFQIWCQLLTHISRCNQSDVLVVDEPEVYLHPEVQRQLLGILRDVNPDIVLATHSVEILSEADPSEVLVIDKSKRSAKRLRDVEGVQQALEAIGSIQNITLTELARNKRLLFVEGMNDYKIIRRFARQLDQTELTTGSGITAMESGGFESWQKVKSLAWGFRNTLGADLRVATIYDRDYRCDEELQQLRESLEDEISLAHFHERKEIENYLLEPTVLNRAANRLLQERARRSGKTDGRVIDVHSTLEDLTADLKHDCSGQYIASFCKFMRPSGRDQATLTSAAMARFETKWENLDTRMEIVPGKEVLRRLRNFVQAEYSITLTDIRIIDAYLKDELPADLIELLRRLDGYRAS